MTGLRVSRCERCRRLVFPRRELCPHCACDAFADESVVGGTVAEMTSHRGTEIACVEIEGARLLARAGEGVRPGARVALAVEDGAPIATSV